MPAGTIALTNNSASVTGTGTSFNTELKVNDFIVAVVGGVPYTLGVKSIESNTALTLIQIYNGPSAAGLAWTPVPFGTMAAITAQLASQVTYAIRGLNLDKANWQQVYSDAVSVTVNLPDGNAFTGPSWGYLASQSATINGKAGGKINGGITISGNAGPVWTNEGFHLIWNEDNATGAGCEVINPGSGVGGKRLKLINKTNTQVLAQFEWKPDGAFYSPNGSYSVGGRVRSFTSVGSNFLEVRLDGNGKGITFFDSDERLKEKVTAADEAQAVGIIESLRPVSYKFKDYTTKYFDNDPVTGDLIEKEATVSGKQHAFGVIAQEYLKIHPEGVITNSDGMLSLDPLEQIGLLLTVCHSQQKTISGLTTRVTELEARMKSVDGLDA